MNDTRQLLVYASDVNLLGENINVTKNKNTKALLEARKEVGLEGNSDKTEYICSCLFTRLQDKIIA
jgi:hypothetical protein